MYLCIQKYFPKLLCQIRRSLCFLPPPLISFSAIISLLFQYHILFPRIIFNNYSWSPNLAMQNSCTGNVAVFSSLNSKSDEMKKELRKEYLNWRAEWNLSLLSIREWVIILPACRAGPHSLWSGALSTFYPFMLNVYPLPVSFLLILISSFYSYCKQLNSW